MKHCLLFLAIFLLSPNLLLLAQKDSLIIEKVDSSNQVHYVVEIMPEFPGGFGALKSFVSDNLNHPIERCGFEGKVYVRFIIDEKGNVIDPVVLKGYNPIIDERALRVVKMLPAWKPGEEDGKKVKVYIILPIDFSHY